MQCHIGADLFQGFHLEVRIVYLKQIVRATSPSPDCCLEAQAGCRGPTSSGC